MSNIPLHLKDRGIIEVKGQDKNTFLQGLLTNNIDKVNAKKSIYSAFLTSQGRFLHDCFIIDNKKSLLLDVAKSHLDDFMRRLNLYKLRSNVKLTDKSETYRVFALLGASLIEASGLEMIEGLTTQHSDRLMFIDPRSSKLGLRAIVSNRVKFDSFLGGPKALEDYDYWRLRYGIPESYKDMISEKSIILESGLDDLKAIDWNKGCYLGQELTTRIKHQGLVRKRLLPVTIEGPSIPSNSEITIEGKKIGTMYSSLKDRGIALLRLQGVKRALKEKISLEHDKSKLVPTIPAWIKGINIDE